MKPLATDPQEERVQALLRSRAAQEVGSIGGSAGKGTAKQRGNSEYYSKLAKIRWRRVKANGKG